MEHNYNNNIPEEIFIELSEAWEAGDQTKVQNMMKAHPFLANEIEEMTSIWADLGNIKTPSPRAEMDVAFYKMLNEEAQKVSSNSNGFDLIRKWLTDKRFWALVGAIMIGFVVGRVTNPNSSSANTKMQSVAPDPSMIFASNQEEISAFDRLEIIQKSRELDEPSMAVIDALNKALIYDKNVSVRLSALETMIVFSDHPRVREYLIKSIPFQDSPIVLMELAELMAALQEKQSSEEWKEVLGNDQTDTDVKYQLEEKLSEIL